MPLTSPKITHPEKPTMKFLIVHCLKHRHGKGAAPFLLWVFDKAVGKKWVFDKEEKQKRRPLQFYPSLSEARKHAAAIAHKNNRHASFKIVEAGQPVTA